MRSFIPWVGGKSRLAKTIVPLIPEHRIYVEPFMGAGWVFFARPDRSPVEALNDLNGDLVTLFTVVRDHFLEFGRRRILLISSERMYKDFVARLQTGEWQNDIERALMFWYALKSAFGAQLGCGWCYSRTRPAKSLDMAELEQVHDRLKGVYISQQDAVTCLKRWDTPETFFYLDPPYILTTTAKGRGYYQHTMTVEDHHRLAEALGRVKGKWLLSYDDDPLVREMYRGYPLLEPEVRYQMNNKPGAKTKKVTELLIANFDFDLEQVGRTA